MAIKHDLSADEEEETASASSLFVFAFFSLGSSVPKISHMLKPHILLLGLSIREK
jgi:hypothetical protein